VPPNGVCTDMRALPREAGGALASVLAFVTEGSATQNRRALAGYGGSDVGTCLLVAGGGCQRWLQAEA